MDCTLRGSELKSQDYALKDSFGVQSWVAPKSTSPHHVPYAIHYSLGISYSDPDLTAA